MNTYLTEALRRFTMICTTCRAPRPGSNFLPFLVLATRDETVTVDGEDLEALYRKGWLDARRAPDAKPIVDHEGIWGGDDVDADHVWGLTEAGRQALASQPADQTRQGEP